MSLKTQLAIAAIVAACFSPSSQAGEHSDDDSGDAITLAVIGDWPYNDLLLANSDLLVNSVNASRRSRLPTPAGTRRYSSASSSSARRWSTRPATTNGPIATSRRRNRAAIR
jgi:hypothetical protein